MPPRKAPPSVHVEHPCTCGTCWYYEPVQKDKGYCMAMPPTLIFDDDGEPFGTNPPTAFDRRGCKEWKPRHNA